jgi:hypothetical protein
MEGVGLKPGAPNGSWVQPVDIIGVNGHPDKLVFTAVGKKLELKYSADFMMVSGHQKSESKVENAEVVFVGYGIVASEYQWNDYKDVDVRGKVLLMMNNDPEDDPNLFAGKTRLWYGRWDYKYEIAAKVGAVAAIVIHTTPSAGYPWQVVQTSWHGEQFSLPYTGGPALQARGWTTDTVSKELCKLGGKDLDELRSHASQRDFRPTPLGVTLSTAFNSAVQKKQSGNVIGILPGSDPKLSKQAVFYTAHHDHLGRKQGAKPGDDEIYNGALDNASGVSAILTIARAFAAQPKAARRTIVFAAVAGEEQGLLGSQYLAEHPPFPAGAIAADINIDGVNIWGRTKDVRVIGYGKSSVDTLVSALAAAQGRVARPDELSDRGFFYRSDQFSFAKKGVPSAYFGSGLDFIGKPPGWGQRQREDWERTHYHQPSDELNDSWDLSGAVEDVQLNFYVGNRIANADRMPEWHKGDEFEQARKRALSAATGMQ